MYFAALLEEHGDGKNGLYHFALWMPTGHASSAASIASPTKGAMMLADVIASATKRYHVTQLFCDLALLLEAVGLLYEAIELENFPRYHFLYKRMCMVSDLNGLRFTEYGCFLGLVLLHNLSAEPHKDVRNTRDEWVAICSFGDFDGGDFSVPEIGRRLQFRPGDVIFYV